MLYLPTLTQFLSHVEARQVLVGPDCIEREFTDACRGVLAVVRGQYLCLLKLMRLSLNFRLLLPEGLKAILQLRATDKLNFDLHIEDSLAVQIRSNETCLANSVEFDEKGVAFVLVFYDFTLKVCKLFRQEFTELGHRN